MPFRIALSGLNAASTDLRVIGNNVANASTTGFKQSRTEFSDIYATSNLGTASDAVGSGVKVSNVAQQFSQGNTEFTNNALDLAISGQGFFRLDDNGTIMYSRAGAFGVDNDGFIVNSSDQKLTGYMVDDIGNVTGAQGSIQLRTDDLSPRATTSVDLGLNLNADAEVPGAAVTSSAIQFGGAILDTNDSPYTTGDFSIFDSYGNEVNDATLQFTPVGGTNWDVELLVGGAQTLPPTIATGVNVGTDVATLSWDPDGAANQPAIPITIDTTGLISQTVGAGASDITALSDGAVQREFSVTDATSYNRSTSLTVFDSLGASQLASFYYRKTEVPGEWESYTFINGTQIPGAQANGSDLINFSTGGKLLSINGVPAPPSSISTADYSPGGGAESMSLTLDYARLTQYGGGFNVNELSQDGFTTGRLSGIDIDDTGMVLARFSNGQTRVEAQVALANFRNPQGLRSLGDTSWAESFDSGAPLVGSPGSSSLGLVQSGALEGSNVDLTEQLVNMITAQRNFQANSQVISTADTITQTIINIR